MQTLQKNFWQEDETTRNVRWYLSTGRQPWLWGMGALLFVYIISAISFLQWPSTLLAQIGWGIIAAAILWSIILVAQTKRQEYAHAITAGFLGGAAMGLVHAVIQLIWWRSGWLFFNLIAEPLFAALSGAVIGLLAVLIWQQIDKLQQRHATSSIVNVVSTEPIESIEAEKVTNEPIDLVLTAPIIPESTETTPVVIETITVEPVAEIVSIVEAAPVETPVDNVPAAPIKSPSIHKKNTKSLARPRYARPPQKQKPSTDQPSAEADRLSPNGPTNPSGSTKRRRRVVA